MWHHFGVYFEGIVNNSNNNNTGIITIIIIMQRVFTYFTLKQLACIRCV